jgi:hypothetical protein
VLFPVTNPAAGVDENAFTISELLGPTFWAKPTKLKVKVVMSYSPPPPPPGLNPRAEPPPKLESMGAYKICGFLGTTKLMSHIS